MKGALRNGHVRPIVHPLGSFSKRHVLGTPTGEGAPQGVRGWGVRLRGSGEEFPSGFGQRPRFGFGHVVTRLCRQGPRRALYIFDA